MTDILKRLQNPPFGLDASERNLIADAAREVAQLRLALVDVLREETVSVHVGYDERGNYTWVDAVRTDSDAFRNLRALIDSPQIIAGGD